MRSAILAIALTILGASAAMAVEMKSINEILSFEASPANSQYAIKRCSALYILLAGLMVGEDEALSAQSQDISGKFFALALVHAKQNELPAVAGANQITIMAMVERYTTLAQDNYLSTGNRLEGVIKEDTEFCRPIAEAMAG
jgi:hypothetical protein